MSDPRVPQPAAYMDLYPSLPPYFSQGSPSLGLPAVPPNLPYPMMAAELSVPKMACAPISLPLQACQPPVIDLPGKLFHTLQQPPYTQNEDDCVTTCAHCHQVNTLLDLRMKKLIQRCKDDAELIHYLRKQIHFRPIPGSEYPVSVSATISYPHIELCKSSNFNVDADEFRPSQKNRSTKTEITNVNNYESAIDGYDMQSHQAVDANDLANAATESGVDSGVHDSGVSDSGILDSNTIDSISESRIPDGDGASNQDSRRSTESLHDDMKNQKKKSKKKDKRKKRLDSDHTISDHSPIGDLEFVNQNRKPQLDSNQNYKPLDPKMTHSSNGSSIIANSNNVDASSKANNDRVLYGGGGGGGGSGGGGSSVDDELSPPKGAGGHHHHPAVVHHHSKTYSSHHHSNHGGAGGPRKSPSSMAGLTDKPPTNGMPERLKSGGMLLQQAPHGRSGRSTDGYEVRGGQPKYAQSHRSDRSLHERHDRHAGPKSTNGMGGVEVRKYAGHPRMRPNTWSSNEYDHPRYPTKRYENSQYNDHGGGHGGHSYSLAKGPAQFVTQVAVRVTELETQHLQQKLDKCVVREVQGDLFEAPADYSLAHCVAEDLRMGAGIAVRFRKDFGCVEELKSQGKKVGQVAFLKKGQRYIYYMITKALSRQKPALYQMILAIQSLRTLCLQHKVTKLAMPVIGCGLDCLDWNDVRPALERAFQDTNIDVVVYHYKEVGAPE